MLCPPPPSPALLPPALPPLPCPAVPCPGLLCVKFLTCLLAVPPPALPCPALPCPSPPCPALACPAVSCQAWSVNRLGYVAYKHRCPDVCLSILNNMYGYNAMEVQEAFVKIREQAKVGAM